ncbi:MAG TPA: hypothetical protein VKU41_27275 [Polyangiaceae bacterium]|nr:hypothetical protein [Polyangiaceae bacterium]
MVDWIRLQAPRADHWLAVRFPSLWLLRVHYLVPILILANVGALVAALINPLSPYAVPDVDERMKYGFLVASVAGLTWAFYVVRDYPTIGPQSLLQKLGGLAGCIACLAGIFLLPWLYAFVLTLRIPSVFPDAECRQWVSTPEAVTYYDLDRAYSGLTQSEFYGDVEQNWDSIATVKFRPYATIRDQETYLENMKAYIIARNDRERTLDRCGETTTMISGRFLPPDEHATFEAATRNARKALLLFQHPTEPALVSLILLGIVLVLLMTLREVPVAFGAIGLAVLIIYSTTWAIVLSAFSTRSDVLFGRVALVHYALWLLSACVQWARRSSSWRERGAALVLGIATPFIPFLFVLAFLSKSGYITDSTIYRLVPASVIFYLIMFPFVYANLERLKFLPRP